MNYNYKIPQSLRRGRVCREEDTTKLYMNDNYKIPQRLRRVGFVERKIPQVIYSRITIIRYPTFEEGRVCREEDTTKLYTHGLQL